MPTVLAFDAYDLGEEEVRSRFAWAVRNGNPSWLWPEVSVEEWRLALARIELATSQILTSGRATEPLTGCARAIGVAGYTSGMGPLLGHWLKQGQLEAEPEVAAVLDLHLRHNSRRMRRMAARAIEVVTRLADRGVAVVVLKGMQTAFASFPVPGVRPVSDIDLLIAPGDRGRASEVLGEMGLVPGSCSPQLTGAQTWSDPEAAPLPRSLAFVHADDPWSVDLQTSLNRRYSTGSSILQLDKIRASGALDRWALGSGAAALAPAAQVLHVACHASCGFGSLSMIRLCELVFVVRKGLRDGRLDWLEVARLGSHSGTIGGAYPALRLSEMLAPGTIPDHVLQLARSHAPSAVFRVMEQLRPANAQTVLRCTVRERFMWIPSLRQVLYDIACDIVPPATSLRASLQIQKRRLYRLLRGAVSWRDQVKC